LDLVVVAGHCRIPLPQHGTLIHIQPAPLFSLPGTGNPEPPKTPVGNFISMFHVAGFFPLARRVALLVSVLYLLRFLRHHLLPAASGPDPLPDVKVAKTTPALSYTLTGEAVVESDDEEPVSASTPLTVGATYDGRGLLWRALAAIVVALAIQVAADVWALLVPVGS